MPVLTGCDPFGSASLFEMEQNLAPLSLRTSWHRGGGRALLRRPSGRDQWRRRHLPLSDLRKIVGSLRRQNRTENELSVRFSPRMLPPLLPSYIRRAHV